jgi:hypothetical protein
MSRHRPTIPQRKPIFIGCEGESEQGYAGFLQDLIHDADLHVHLNIEVLRAGDPLARIELAIKKLEHARRKRVNFTDRFVFLDTDQLALSADKAHRARQIATANDIRVIWQAPCFEALLLRHFVGRTSHRPLTNQAAESALRKEWPQYQKPMSRAELAHKIDREAVCRAAGVEGDLMTLLRCVGLMPPEGSR